MAYVDIQAPLVGDKQIKKIGGSDNIIELQPYLAALNGNLDVTHGDLSPIRVNGVVGETMTVPVATASLVQPINGAVTYMIPVVFPTAGTIRKTITTTEKPGIITAMFQATLTCVVAQASVFPAIGFAFEVQNVGGNWQQVPGYELQDLFAGGFAYTLAAGTVISLAMRHYFIDLRPLTTYRVTAMAGVSSSIALPHTGQWKIDAVGTNTLEFNAWGN